LDLLVCPACQGSLSLTVHQAQGNDIQDGLLTCQGCGRSYPITAGVPRLLAKPSDPQTAKSFGFEWQTVDVTDVEEDVVTFFRKTGLDERVYEGCLPKERCYPTLRDLGFTPDGFALAGKLVLDAGCGMGRYLNVVKAYGCELVGMDFSDSVERAARLCAGPQGEKIHIVQGDIFAPPFRPETFDYIYSIGCLHHTPDPQAAFRSLAVLCQGGGGIAVHVYPPEFWLDPLRGAIMRAVRAITVRLPHPLLWRLCQLTAPPLGLLQMQLAAHPVTKWLGAPFFLITIPRHRKLGVMIGDTFDTYSAKHIRTFPASEVKAWFESAGVEDVDALPYPTTVKGRKRSCSAPSES
jgi:SAM-dependent methyltransferase/uncharacterized protein YbaR (Trm112 family)